MNLDSLNLESLYYIFNIFAPFITTIGIIISFCFSIKTLKEVRRDRILAQKPYLIFEQGGRADKAIFVKSARTSPGFNPDVMQIVKNSIPEDAISIQREFIKNKKFFVFGILKNYGNGPAFNITLTWIPKVIWINNEKFVIDKKKKKKNKRQNIRECIIQNLLESLI